MAKAHYFDSAFGTAVYPHILHADARFNADRPLFKVKLRLDGEDAQNLKARIDAGVKEAMDDFMENGDGAKMTPGERKKITAYYPYEEEEDDAGEKTGSILFEFKQNTQIRLKDGTVKDIVIGIYDAAGKPMHKEVGGGSIIRVNYSIRPIPMKSLKQVGVRLDFGRVQVKDWKEPRAAGGGFGAVDGYEDDGEDQQDSGFGAVSGAGGADY